MFILFTFIRLQNPWHLETAISFDSNSRINRHCYQQGEKLLAMKIGQIVSIVETVFVNDDMLLLFTFFPWHEGNGIERQLMFTT